MFSTGEICLLLMCLIFCILSFLCICYLRSEIKEKEKARKVGK